MEHGGFRSYQLLLIVPSTHRSLLGLSSLLTSSKSFGVASSERMTSVNTILPPGFSTRAASATALCLCDPPSSSASWEQTTSQLESGMPVSKYDFSPGMMTLSSSPAVLVREALKLFSCLQRPMQITLKGVGAYAVGKTVGWEGGRLRKSGILSRCSACARFLTSAAEDTKLTVGLLACAYCTFCWYLIGYFK